MERLTSRWKCGLASFPHGMLPETIERLATIKDILGDDYDLDRLRELVEADRAGRIARFPFVAMVEQSMMNGTMSPKKDQIFNGRYAVVYSRPDYWKRPLIDICGSAYDDSEAEERRKAISSGNGGWDG